MNDGFYTDRQTVKDLDLFENKDNRSRSIFKIFDCVATYGGRYRLREMFERPLSDSGQIRERVDLIGFLSGDPVDLKLDKSVLDFIEHYLSLATIPTRKSYINTLRRRLSLLYRTDNEWYIIKRGIAFLMTVIGDLHSFAGRYAGCENGLLKKYCLEIQDIFNSADLFSKAKAIAKAGKALSVNDISVFDSFFRYTAKNKVRELLYIVYQMDVFFAVSVAAKNNSFVLPAVSESSGIEIEGLFHPLIDNPVANDMALSRSENVCFITGANMSGKSTFLKAFGLAMYLAHMGFPVPAKRMTFSIYDGLFSTINIADNLALGYSHFYSEVRRIKEIANIARKATKLIVIFDELFRGTNLKDAHEGSVAIIKAFSHLDGSVFLFSTRITEVATELKDIQNIKFVCFKTDLIGDELSYQYKIREGVSDDRLGMYIINREEIIDLIMKSAAKK